MATARRLTVTKDGKSRAEDRSAKLYAKTTFIGKDTNACKWSAVHRKQLILQAKIVI